MWRLTTLCLLALSLSLSAFAQSTTVSGTITDTPDGQAWYAGTYSFVFRTAPSNPVGPYFWNGAPFSTSQTIAGNLDGSGHYSVSVPSNTSITPSGSTWDLTVCPLATAACFTVQSVTITGGSQTVAPIPPSIRINMFSAPPSTRAYTDTEVVNGYLGQQYFNTGIPATKVCSSLPCGWTSIGGGGSATAPFLSLTSPSASTGTLRLGNNESGVCWRNAANTGDVCLTVDPTNNFTNICTSVGTQGVLQAASTAGTCKSTNLTETAGVLNNGDTNSNRGPNPGVDITAFNGRAINPNVIPTTTGTITGGTNSLTVASAANWQTNDGLSLIGGGQTNCATPPLAPTVTPSLASAMTGTGYAVAGATGSTSYSYAVVGISQGGCYTAASPVGSTATGNATLGPTNKPITSCANVLGTTTCTVGSTSDLANGTWVRQSGTTDDSEFGGYFQITVLNGTQYTFTSGISSLYWMSSSTSTGGTLYYWTSNHITLPALPAGTNMYKEAVYRCTGASCALPANAANYTLFAITYPLTLTNTASDPSYGVVDDYGTTMSPTLGTSSSPWFLPTTPPSSNVNDLLTTTVTNISGTTFTLATNASNSTSGASMRFDIVPAWSAAQAASKTFSTGGGGAVHFPPAVENSGTGAYCYVTSSYFSVSGNVNLGAPLCLGDTLNQGVAVLNGTYENSVHMQFAGHAAEPLMEIRCVGANPCILRQNGPIKNLQISDFAGTVIEVFDTSTTSTITSNVVFNTSATDFTGVAYYYYNDASGTGQFGGDLTKTSWLSAVPQSVGSTSTPLFISKNGQYWNFDYYTHNGRGFYFDCNASNLACVFADVFKNGQQSAGLSTPTYTFNNSSANNRGGSLYFEHIAGDSFPEPFIVNASTTGTIGAPLIINGVNVPASGMPIISGKPFQSGIAVTMWGPHLNNQIGVNHDIFVCPEANRGFTGYDGCTLPSLNVPAVTVTANHTLSPSEGNVIVNGTATITIPVAPANGMWSVFSKLGTTTLTPASGTLFGSGATGNIVIPNNQGMMVFEDGVNAYAYGIGGGGAGGSPGGSTDALQYNGGGGSFGGVNSPTANGNYNVHYNVTASAAVPPAIDLPGVPVNPQTGTTYTYLYSDRGSLVTANNSGAQTYTLVNPSSTGFGSNFFNVLKNIGTAAVTENASGFTVNGGASLLVPPSWTRFLWSDGVNYTASRFPDFGAFVNCTGAGNALQFTSATGVFSCGASSSGVASLTGDGALITNSLSTGAVTLTLGAAGAHKVWMNNTGISATPGYQSIGEADLPATTVFTDKANTMGAFLFDLSAGTTKIPTSAGCTAGATAMICYDSTNKNWHIYDNNADAIGLAIPSAPTTGDLADYAVAAGQVLAHDSGVATANVVTAASAAAAAKQVCTSSGASKTCSYIDYPETFYVPAANCVNAQAASAWSTGATPASLCRAGTNNKDGLLSPWGASDVGYFKVHLPNDWDSGASLDISIDLTSTDATNGHTIIMQASTSCAKGDGSTTDDVAFNAAQSFGTITLNGNANRTWNATLTGLTKTGCIAGSTLWVKISRTTDTATNVGVYGATVDVARLITVQAN